jgi:hypothetical protein
MPRLVRAFLFFIVPGRFKLKLSPDNEVDGTKCRYAFNRQINFSSWTLFVKCRSFYAASCRTFYVRSRCFLSGFTLMLLPKACLWHYRRLPAVVPTGCRRGLAAKWNVGVTLTTREANSEKRFDLLFPRPRYSRQSQLLWLPFLFVAIRFWFLLKITYLPSINRIL